MGKICISRSSSKMIFIFTLLMALIASAGAAEAASFLNNCTTNCHGMPPRDGARKGNPRFNSQSSAFLGNHRGHLSAAPSANDCSVCHAPVAATAFGHQNNIIEMAAKLKGYSTATGRARYDKGVFFNQTSIPNLTNATCSNASCHFERKTPVWGSAAFNPATDCNACHGAPPSGAASGTAGSHARHDAYYPGTANCQKCHPGHVTFSHATSAGSPLQVQGFLRDPLNSLEASATYSGNGLNYLPSKSASQVFGSCNNLYCHSTGQSVTGAGAGTAVSVNWGGAALNCGSCHQNMGPAVNASATGKHAKHAQAAGIACSVCHGAGYTGTTAPTGSGSIHVNKSINLAWTGLAAAPATTYTKGNSFAAGSAAYGSCSNSYCHSTVQNATTGLAGATYRSVSWASATTLTCAGCHVDMATDATGSGSHRIHSNAAGANLDCAVCHLNYTRTSTTAAAAMHSNGQIELGAAGFTYSQGAAHAPANGFGTCSASACHGQATVTWGATFTTGATFPYSASQCDKCHSGTATAPFYSTAIPKVTANTNAKVGAHTSHLTAPDGLATAFACADCHNAVTTVNSANHMNGTTNFNWSTLATRNGTLTPVYTASTGACSNVYCHGASMPGGDTSGSNRAPVWNSTTYLPATLTAAACGTCHGFPPPASSGHPAITVPAGFPATASIGTTCSCHDNVRTTGNSYATIFVNKSLHINGILEVASGGTCDTCHGYPPASAGFVGSQNNWQSAKPENYLGGGGAHTVASHVSNLANPADGFSNCTKCHNAADHVMSPIAFNPNQNIKVRGDQRFRLEAAKQFKYSSNRLNANSHVTGTCSNSSCHFGATPKWDPAH